MIFQKSIETRMAHLIEEEWDQGTEEDRTTAEKMKMGKNKQEIKVREGKGKIEGKKAQAKIALMKKRMTLIKIWKEMSSETKMVGMIREE